MKPDKGWKLEPISGAANKPTPSRVISLFMHSILKVLSLLLFCFISCTNNGTDESSILTDDNPQPNSNFVIPVGKTFEWRLDDLPDTYNTSAEVVDIDAFAATPELVANLKAEGKTVIAYLSVGSVENFRPDAGDFFQILIGNEYEGFPDENWLDIREINLLAPIMEARLDMIASKGFDGIEPDNINGYQNNTGFNLTQENAIAYCRYLIEQAHLRDLSIGQKNAEELIPTLVDEFDWFLAEDAYVEDFYQQLTPFITAEKAVFLVEYTDRISEANFQSMVCPEASARNYSAVLKDRDLTDTTLYCN